MTQLTCVSLSVVNEEMINKLKTARNHENTRKNGNLWLSVFNKWAAKIKVKVK